MNEELRHEIVRRYHAGQSARGIARDLGLGRERVRRLLAEHQQARGGAPPASALPQPGPRRASGLDDYEQVMRELLARYPHPTGYLSTSRPLTSAATPTWNPRGRHPREASSKLNPATQPRPLLARQPADWLHSRRQTGLIPDRHRQYNTARGL